VARSGLRKADSDKPMILVSASSLCADRAERMEHAKKELLYRYEVLVAVTDRSRKLGLFPG